MNSATDRRLFDGGGPLGDPEERRVIFATLDSFRQYRRSAHFNVTHRRRQNLYALPEQQRQALAAPPFSLFDTLNEVDDAIDCNADVADAILELGLQTFGLPAEPTKGTDSYWYGAATPDDMAKAHSTIRQFYRDWSHEGFLAEVQPILGIVCTDLVEMLTKPSDFIAPPCLLLPGAGLGRLLFLLSLQGYNVEGNEISYHQLLASNFILNTTQRAHQYKLYPFVTTFTNHKSRTNQMREVLIPDIHPASTLSRHRQSAEAGRTSMGEMNMTAGDFLTSYGASDSKGAFDGVVSIYFIDTAPNLIRYVETVKNCLRDGGIWINIGPLLWHFDDRRIGDAREHRNDDDRQAEDSGRPSLSESFNMADDTGIGEPGSFELTDEEVLSLLKTMGFEILKHEYLPVEQGGYIQDPESMIQNRYGCSHWVARRLPAAAGS